MIPASWLTLVRAPIGKILVKRKPMERMWHGIHIPDSTLENVRTATGFVVDIHKDVPRNIGYCVGDYVALSPGGGIQITFGLTGGAENELWLFGASAVKAVFLEEPEKFEDHGEDVLRNKISVERDLQDGKHVWTEGQREGLR